MKALIPIASRTAGPVAHRQPAGQSYPARSQPGAITPQAIADSPQQAVQRSALAGLPVQLKCSKCGSTEHISSNSQCPGRPPGQPRLTGFARMPQPTRTITPPVTNNAPQASSPGPLTATTPSTSTAPLMPQALAPSQGTNNALQSPGPGPLTTTTTPSSSTAPLLPQALAPSQLTADAPASSSSAPKQSGNWLRPPIIAERLPQIQQQFPHTVGLPREWVKSVSAANRVNGNDEGAPLSIAHSPQSTPENSDDEDVISNYSSANYPNHSYTDLTQDSQDISVPNYDENRKYTGQRSVPVAIDRTVRSDMRAAARITNNLVARNGNVPFERAGRLPEEERQRRDRQARKIQQDERDARPKLYPNSAPGHKPVVAHKPDRVFNQNKASSLGGLHALGESANKLEGSAGQGYKPRLAGHILKERARNGSIVYTRPDFERRLARKERLAQAQATAERPPKRLKTEFSVPTATCKGLDKPTGGHSDDERDDPSGGGQGGGLSGQQLTFDTSIQTQ